MPENLVSRDGFGSPVPCQPAHSPYSEAESGAYLRDSSRVPRRRPFSYFKPPYAIGSVPILSGHAVAYRWRSLPRVRRPRASKLQGSSERVLPWQVTMDQLIYASLSHTHYWYEVGMLKVPAIYTAVIHHLFRVEKKLQKRHFYSLTCPFQNATKTPPYTLSFAFQDNTIQYNTLELPTSPPFYIIYIYM